MTKTQNFSTLDIYLASFLSLHQQEPLLELKTGKVVFTFQATDSLYQLMNLYNSDSQVPVATYSTQIKTLRGKMLTLKESIHGNDKGAGYGKRFNKA